MVSPSLDRKLAVLRAKPWLPPELFSLVETVCRLQAETPVTVVPDEAAIRSGHEHRQGVPLLERTAFPVDEAGAKALFLQLLAACEALPHLKTAILVLRDGMVRGEIVPEALFRALMAQDERPFDAWAEQAPDAPQLLEFVVYNSLLPWLEATGAALAARFPEPGTWQHGHCPVCGSPAFIGHLAEGKPTGNDREINKGGARMHTCSFCRTTYRAKRIQCPFCLEEDAAKLDFFSVEGEPQFQAHVCRSCKAYIKIADFREAADAGHCPPLDDLESLPLDFAALREGFHRVAPSEWGL